MAELTHHDEAVNLNERDASSSTPGPAVDRRRTSPRPTDPTAERSSADGISAVFGGSGEPARPEPFDDEFQG